jgi:hypothetical protein
MAGAVWKVAEAQGKTLDNRQIECSSVDALEELEVLTRVESFHAWRRR